MIAPDLTLADVETDVLDRHHAAETQRDVPHFHHHPADLATIGGDVTFLRGIKHLLGLSRAAWPERKINAPTSP